MKLLILTQKVDKDDPILGFFHYWLKEFAKHFSQVTVVCLYKGEYDLPANVRVLSLGKESGVSRIKYVFRFYKYIWQYRREYENVFVHMNQEYVLLGGIFWKILNKKIILWRNHPTGNGTTKIAVSLADLVYCTSKESFTARFKKTKIMPVGIDTSLFFRDKNIQKLPKSILFLSRIAPIKNPDILLAALAILKNRNIDFKASFFGDPLKQDLDFYQQLKNQTISLGLENMAQWLPAVSNWQTPRIYNQFEVFVNLTPAGSMDKTIFEAMACQAFILTSNPSLADALPENFRINYKDSDDLADKLATVLSLSYNELENYGQKFREYVIKNHSLDLLIKKIKTDLKNL